LYSQDKPKLPFLIGKEASGVVTAVGARVKAFKPGDAVCGVGDAGAFADEWVVHQASVWRVPGELSWGQHTGAIMAGRRMQAAACDSA
jgi:NADPH2:quinone reductase